MADEAAAIALSLEEARMRQAEWERRYAQADHILESRSDEFLGARVVRTEQDGNCFFEAIGKAVGKTATEVRAAISALLQGKCTANAGYAATLLADATARDPSITDCAGYIAKISRSGEYAGEAEVLAAEELYGRSIIIWKYTVDPVHGDTIASIRSTDAPIGVPINLLYFDEDSGAHYDLIDIPLATDLTLSPVASPIVVDDDDDYAALAAALLVEASALAAVANRVTPTPVTVARKPFIAAPPATRTKRSVAGALIPPTGTGTKPDPILARLLRGPPLLPAAGALPGAVPGGGAAPALPAAGALPGAVPGGGAPAMPVLHGAVPGGAAPALPAAGALPGAVPGGAAPALPVALPVLPRAIPGGGAAPALPAAGALPGAVPGGAAPVLPAAAALPGAVPGGGAAPALPAAGALPGAIPGGGAPAIPRRPLVAIPIAPAVKDDITGVYIIWKDCILVHQRGPGVNKTGTISTPGGSVDNGETFVQAALRELKEEAQLTLGGVQLPAARLIPFRDMPPTGGRTRRMVFFGVELTDAEKVAILGPEPTYQREVMVMDKTVNSLPGYSANNNKYRWVQRDYLEQWLTPPANPTYYNSLFHANLSILNGLLGGVVAPAPVPAGGPVAAAAAAPSAGMPAWVPAGLIGPDDVKDACKGQDFITSDCVAKSVLADIALADEFKDKGRLSQRTNAMKDVYSSLVSDIAAAKAAGDTATQAKKEAELKAKFGPEQIIVRRGGEEEVLEVPNPYAAMEYREDPVFKPTFANPAGVWSVHDPAGKMSTANLKVLHALAPTEMIADHDMAVALLESLWFCGRNPTLSSDPRCFPAQVLGELREWQANKRALQDADALKQRLLDEATNWPTLKSWTEYLMRAAPGGAAAAPAAPAGGGGGGAAAAAAAAAAPVALAGVPAAPAGGGGAAAAAAAPVALAGVPAAPAGGGGAGGAAAAAAAAAAPVAPAGGGGGGAAAAAAAPAAPAGGGGAAAAPAAVAIAALAKGGRGALPPLVSAPIIPLKVGMRVPPVLPTPLVVRPVAAV